MVQSLKDSLSNFDSERFFGLRLVQNASEQWDVDFRSDCVWNPQFIWLRILAIWGKNSAGTSFWLCKIVAFPPILESPWNPGSRSRRDCAF